MAGAMLFPWVFLNRWMRMKNLYCSHVPVNIISPLDMRWWMAQQTEGNISLCFSLSGLSLPFSLPSFILQGLAIYSLPGHSSFDVFPMSTAPAAIWVPIRTWLLQPYLALTKSEPLAQVLSWNRGLMRLIIAAVSLMDAQV